ncbi:EAL domain-containing protein [Ningiella sp. W23]|uniref:EAL domain-containing protein n=1 Tax=Ningiella sp. W23 TaxID=3023715 RepID=UPI003756EA3B
MKTQHYQSFLGLLFSIAFLINALVYTSLASAQTGSELPLNNTSLAQSDGHIVSADFDASINLTNNAEFLITDQSLLLSDVLQEQQWRSHTEIVNIEEESALWIRFQIDNFADSNRLLTLVAGNTFVDRAEAYLLDEQLRIVQSSRLQSESPTSANLSRSGFKMTFTARSNSLMTIYLRIQDDGLSVIPVELWQADAYNTQAGIRLILLGAMSGGLSLLATYFLFTYVLRNAPSRFWFCVFATAAMTTMLSTEGILPMLFMVPSFAAELTAISLTVTLFAAIKITRIIFQPISRLWLRAHYVLLVFPLIGIFVFNDLYQLISLIVFSFLFLLSKLVATFIYRKGIDLRSTLIYFSGWFALGIVGLIELSMLVNNTGHLSFSAPYPFIFSCIGVMLIGVAIISREQSIQSANSGEQVKKIQELQQYNDLFQHAAEGLYTAHPSGELIHINPAICALFGYEDSHAFLAGHKHLSSFFAQTKDADLLLGELSIQQTVLGKEVKGKRIDGSEFWFSISAQLKKIGDTTLQFGSLFDVTERRLHQVNLQYLNSHDQLTGLYNRRHFLSILEERIQSHDEKASEFALLFLDVDQFKLINDTCGHTAGDVFIKELSHVLFDVVHEQYAFARLSADQFGIIAEFSDKQELSALTDALLDSAQTFEFKWDKHRFIQSISIGISIYEPMTNNTLLPNGEEMLAFADTACIIAKEDAKSGTHGNRKNKAHIYSADMHLHSSYQKHLYWVNEVKHALTHGNFSLFYQHYRPLAHNDEFDYYEILLRLKTQDGDLVAPEFFMPSAEKSGLSNKIDKWVIESYFKWLNQNKAHQASLAKVNINLSGISLSDEDFKFFLLNAFDKYQIPHGKVCFEVTETMAIIRLNDAISFMKEFKKLGCSFALDDFGTGFSSYSYLKNLPVDYLKIDGNFIRDILNDKIDLAMVTSIRDVADAMKIQTVAEFVESQEIMVQVGKLGVDFAQGFAIAKPAPILQYASYTLQPDLK